MLHSLWIGALIYLLLFAFKTISTPKAAVLKTLYQVAFAVFFILLSYVWINSYKLEIKTFVEILNSAPMIQFNNSAAYHYWFGALFLGFWFCGVSFLFYRWINAKNNLNEILIHSKLAEPHWRMVMDKLCTRYKLEKVKLYQCSGIRSAFVTGLWRPIIVIPTAWMNSLSVEEAEYVLSHELMHLLDDDHWTNLMIQWIEILFFFNPAILKLCNEYRSLREYTADRFVENEPYSKIKYAKLLLRLHEFNSKGVQAMGVHFLSDRVVFMNMIQSKYSRVFGMILTLQVLISFLILLRPNFKQINQDTYLVSDFVYIDNTCPVNENKITTGKVTIKKKRKISKLKTVPISKREVLISSKPIENHNEDTPTSKTIPNVSRRMNITQVSEIKSRNDTSQVIVIQNVAEPLAAEGVYDLQIIRSNTNNKSKVTINVVKTTNTMMNQDLPDETRQIEKNINSSTN
ncbi:MAG: M56 family metallopeptidase [Saprospiraceae bacterium]|nr:M56 family metallopeptidase [Saprospiraceae bacterium]